MWKQHIILIFVLASFTLTSFAHGSFEEHVKDIQEVFGIKSSSEFKDWAKFISSTSIDKHNENNFYDSLKEKFPGFTCEHRFLFHWGYQYCPIKIDKCSLKLL